jgi:hypothetical protein
VLTILILVDIFVYKYEKIEEELLKQNYLELFGVRLPIMFILFLNVYIIDSSLIFFLKRKFQEKRIQEKSFNFKEILGVLTVIAFIVLVFLYAVFFVALFIVDIVYIDNLKNPTNFQLTFFLCVFMDYRWTNVFGSLMLINIFYNMSLKY